MREWKDAAASSAGDPPCIADRLKGVRHAAYTGEGGRPKALIPCRARASREHRTAA